MGKRQAKLIYSPGSAEEEAFPFVDEIEIGRSHAGDAPSSCRVALPDRTLSSRHCIVTQTDDGRFFIRDVSRNGTHVDGKRLVPSLEFELEPGQAVEVGMHRLVLWAAPAGDAPITEGEGSTVLSTGLAIVTVLVGDVRDYTSLSQQKPSPEVSRAMRAVFSELETEVSRHQGTIKEYPGDAIFAFWEETVGEPRRHAADACDTALALAARVGELARAPGLWTFPDFPLRMDWALATGAVVISNFGRDRPTGLSMVGDIVNLAFRLEKLATDETGPILAASNTRDLAAADFEFTDLGEVSVKGRRGVERIFALRGRKPPPG